MSEPSAPVPADPQGNPGVSRPRYQRSTGGLLGAMIVTVLAVVAFVGLRSIGGDNEATPVRAVDYSGLVKAARADGKLRVLVPARVPIGWKATSATYPVGSAHWHLGFLTDDRKYVGIEEGREGTAALVEKYVDADATQGKDVQVGGQTWKTWTDSGGDYALTRTLTAPDGQQEHVLVVGSASEQDVRDLAAGLTDQP